MFARSPSDVPVDDVQRRRDRLGCATLVLACLGCIAPPFGCFLLAWSGLVSFVMVGGAVRDGRPVSRLALAALVVTIVGPVLLWWLFPLLART